MPTRILATPKLLGRQINHSAVRSVLVVFTALLQVAWHPSREEKISRLRHSCATL